MREIIYYSRTAPTSGKYVNEDDLYSSGRLDIPIHSVIAGFFLSQKIRADVRMHLVFAGPPSTPRHLELAPVTEGRTGLDKIYINKKNIAGIIKKLLYKYREGEKHEVFPGFWIEEKGFLELVNDLHKEGREIFILDPKGEDIRTAKIGKDPIFILGDHRGLPDKEFKRLKQFCKPITIGPTTYFASHTIAVVHNELDRREYAEGRLQAQLKDLSEKEE
jgi:tRNA (pseudouridine54-N1)-methyltransferase